MLDLKVLGLTPEGVSTKPTEGRTARLTNGTPQAMVVHCPEEVCRQQQGNAEGAQSNPCRMLASPSHGRKVGTPADVGQAGSQQMGQDRPAADRKSTAPALCTKGCCAVQSKCVLKQDQLDTCRAARQAARQLAGHEVLRALVVGIKTAHTGTMCQGR